MLGWSEKERGEWISSNMSLLRAREPAIKLYYAAGGAAAPDGAAAAADADAASAAAAAAAPVVRNARFTAPFHRWRAKRVFGYTWMYTGWYATEF
jgi:hypothetical protein